jgi:hypothetical protein
MSTSDSPVMAILLFIAKEGILPYIVKMGLTEGS